MTWESLNALLLWIATGGGAMLLAGAVVSLLLANWTWFNETPKLFKVLLPIVLAGFFGTGAQLLLAIDVSAFIPPQIAGLLLVLLNYLGSQWQYMSIKGSTYALSARSPELKHPG